AAPAVAVEEGWVVMTSWPAAAGLTTMLPDVAELTPGALVVKAMLRVSALLYERLVNVPTPLTSVTVVVPCRVEVPRLPRAAVLVCVLSAVVTLPKASSSLNTGWAGEGQPAGAGG